MVDGALQIVDENVQTLLRVDHLALRGNSGIFDPFGQRHPLRARGPGNLKAGRELGEVKLCIGVARRVRLVRKRRIALEEADGGGIHRPVEELVVVVEVGVEVGEERHPIPRFAVEPPRRLLAARASFTRC